MTASALHHRGHRNYQAGLAAEGIVERHYVSLGATLIAQRWRGKHGGEIDLIFRHGDRLIFVEVKKSKSHASAASRITRVQMARIMTSATEFLDGKRAPMRIDVALVDGIGAVKVIENAPMGMW